MGKADQAAWEANAQFWDEQMGPDSNRFHREVVRPLANRLLAPRPGEHILEAACGNGNYAAYLAGQGVQVTAFDYSPAMVALAKARQRRYLKHIRFLVADGTSLAELQAMAGPFDKAVCNMAVMDMAAIEPLFTWIFIQLKPGGCFVFVTQHPCFVTLTEQYLTPHSYDGEAIAGQPRLQRYYHRSLTDILGQCFASGFVLDGFLEGVYGPKERPDVIAVRARKPEKE